MATEDDIKRQAGVVFVIGTVLIGVVGYVIARPSWREMWPALAMLAISTHILFRAIRNEEIFLVYNIVSPNDQKGRIFAFVVGLVLYGWSMYTLFASK